VSQCPKPSTFRHGFWAMPQIPCFSDGPASGKDGM
jgi:hypothetical protein